MAPEAIMASSRGWTSTRAGVIASRVMLNLRTLVLGGLVAGLGLALTACSSLTRPDEITIVAEPLPSPNAPPKMAEGDHDGHDHGGEAPGRRIVPAEGPAAGTG